jgi:hypothetical protein
MPTWVPVLISALAFLVSLTSLGFSIYNIVRDRARIQIKSQFYPPSQYGKGHISITIMNTGRRPMILRMLGYEGDDNWVGAWFGDHERGLRLGENERHDVTVSAEDLGQDTPDDTINVTTIWLEDSLGRRYTIKGIEKQIQQLRDS